MKKKNSYKTHNKTLLECRINVYLKTFKNFLDEVR